MADGLAGPRFAMTVRKREEEEEEEEVEEKCNDEIAKDATSCTRGEAEQGCVDSIRGARGEQAAATFGKTTTRAQIDRSRSSSRSRKGNQREEQSIDSDDEQRLERERERETLLLQTRLARSSCSEDLTDMAVEELSFSCSLSIGKRFAMCRASRRNKHKA